MPSRAFIEVNTAWIVYLLYLSTFNFHLLNFKILARMAAQYQACLEKKFMGHKKSKSIVIK